MNKAELIVALDCPEKEDAIALARSLCGVVSWVKVGMTLFSLAGPDVLKELRDMGFHVFLDMKFYDIPHTVGGAVRAACRSGAEMLTLHVQGGARMCEAAREAADASATPPRLFGVTALTSFDRGEMPGIQIPPAAFALELAGLAAQWKLDGVVCSALDVASVKIAAPSMACLCPGIRPGGDAADDQRRIMTPGKAVMAGANYLVVGRPVIRAADPAQAARDILVEMRGESR